MKKTIKLTESELISVIKKVINEQTQPDISGCFKGITPPSSCNASPVADKPMDLSKCLADIGAMALKVGPKKVFEVMDCIKNKTSVNY